MALLDTLAVRADVLEEHNAGEALSPKATRNAGSLAHLGGLGIGAWERAVACRVISPAPGCGPALRRARRRIRSERDPGRIALDAFWWAAEPSATSRDSQAIVRA